MRSFLLAVASLATFSNARSSTFSPLRPPSLPLAVRSPYLSTWQQAGNDGGNGGYLAGQWPTFWQGQVTGWAGFITVDGTAYNWLGASPQNTNHVNQTAYEYTSTRSIFKMTVGDVVKMKVTFLSPVTPDELLRSSLPYSYMDVEVISLDGKSHDVQLYTDISAEWVSGDHTANAQWDYGVTNDHATPSYFADPATPPSTIVQGLEIYGTELASSVKSGYIVAHTENPIGAPSQDHTPTPGHGRRDEATAQKTRTTNVHAPKPTVHLSQQRRSAGGVAYHQVFRQEQLEFSETNQQANWGKWYYATANTKQLTYQSGQGAVVRGNFLSNGILPNTQDTNYRGIDDDWPVFGFAVNLGSVSTTAVNTVFQLSLHQDNCVQFEGTNGVQPVPCLWTNYFSSDLAAVEYFYNDYPTYSTIATTFDHQIATDSTNAGGEDYRSLTSLAVRQAFGALEFTNTPDAPYVFLKEISSDGNVQTVDVIFPFHPIAVYMNATILKYMLDPLFINQEAGNWPYQFSIHDLGSSFPNATGHNDGNDEQQPLEECGDMLIMTLAYAQRTGDNAYLSDHYPLLEQWNNYLVNESLIPQNQISTDDFAGALANQTNLAIKGIIAIEAMAQIANRTGHIEDGQNFTEIAHSYIQQWQGYGITTDTQNFSLPHTMLAYNMPETYSLLYNLWADAELGLHLVPESVYTMESNFYPTVFLKYGVPLDTRHGYTKADWQIFCAAIAESDTQKQFISTLATWLDQTPTNFAFTDLYDAFDGNFPPNGPIFITRPVVGGMFALLALNSAPTSGYVKPS